MINPAYFYLLLSALLFVVAVVVHFHTASLSLPLSPLISILTILLPILSFLNAFIHPSLLQRSHTSRSILPRLTPLILQTLQALIATILATLLLERTIPGQTIECALESRWMHLWRAHDADGIRTIQDALNCCGLNSVKDRAYPWASGAGSCAEVYRRSVACRMPWRRAMQTTAGVDLAVVLAVGVMQIIGLFMMREDASWWDAWQAMARGGRQPNGIYESRRPLLPPVEADEEETVERVERIEGGRGYGSVNGVGHLPNGHDDDEEEAGPRVEVSGIGGRNAWRDE